MQSIPLEVGIGDTEDRIILVEDLTGVDLEDIHILEDVGRKWFGEREEQ